jgi:nucleotidyltransferase/DNA polymerase involved in DNA repair
VAKIASSQAKPNGIYEVPGGVEAQFLAPLPVQSLPGVGFKTQQLLNRSGIKKIADLQAMSPDVLIRHYGAWGYHYYLAARGKDNRPVDWEESLPKSIGAETTFEKDYDDLEFLKHELTQLVMKAHRRMLANRMRTKRISLKLRYDDFRTVTRSHTLITHYKEQEKILKEVLKLFEGSYSGEIPLRLIGVSFELLTDGYWQPTLWDM